METNDVQPKYGVVCCFPLPTGGDRGPHREACTRRALSHMPARVVYLSAAAAVEDCGIRTGRE